MTLADGLSVWLVFLIGFAAHRASLCTVRAVMQWLDDHKASVLISFIKAAAWSCLLAGVFGVACRHRIRLTNHAPCS